MSIAIQADVEALLQIEFDLPNEPKVTAVIQAAQRMVEVEVGTPFDAATGLVATLTGKGQPVLTLPRWPVSAVASVVREGVTLVEGDDYEWSAAGYLEKPAGLTSDAWWSYTKGIVVTYDAGWADETAAPGGLRQLVARVASRIWQTGTAFAENQGASGIVQETIGAYSVTYGDFAKDTASAAMLSEEDRQLARQFRRARMRSVAT